MQRLSGSAGRPADHYCNMYDSKPKAPPADSSAVQPAHQLSDADRETTTGDGSYKRDQCKKEAAKPDAPPPVRYATILSRQNLSCAVCKRACGYPHGDVYWSKEEDVTMRVPTCGPRCLFKHSSNVLWRFQCLNWFFRASADSDYVEIKYLRMPEFLTVFGDGSHLPRFCLLLGGDTTLKLSAANRALHSYIYSYSLKPSKRRRPS